MKQLQLSTPEEKAARVIAANGQRPNMLKTLESDEVAALAEMIQPDGTLLGATVEGVEIDPRERFRLFMIDYNERRKATDAEQDEPQPVTED